LFLFRSGAPGASPRAGIRRASGAFIRPWALIDSWIRNPEAGGSGWHRSRLRRFHSPMGVDRLVDP